MHSAPEAHTLGSYGHTQALTRRSAPPQLGHSPRPDLLTGLANFGPFVPAVSTFAKNSNRPPPQRGALVEKHSRECAVNLFDGAYSRGESHAPLVYAGDPRQDVPSELRKHLTETLRYCDGTIVKGWLEGIAQGGAEDLGLE